MAKAVLAPLAAKPAQHVGGRRWRKQLLPIGSIDYRGRRIEFTPEYLDELVRNFEAKPLDQVPFVLADDQNRHNDNPERHRGSVIGLRREDDGLYAEIDLSEKGAELVRENPELGVSARIVEGFEDAGRRFGKVLSHICGTLEPKVKGMRPWEYVALAAAGASSVIDLTVTYADSPSRESTEEHELTEAAEAAARWRGQGKGRPAVVLTDELDEEDGEELVELAASADDEQEREEAHELAMAWRQTAEVSTETGEGSTE